MEVKNVSIAKEIENSATYLVLQNCITNTGFEFLTPDNKFEKIDINPEGTLGTLEDAEFQIWQKLTKEEK